MLAKLAVLGLTQSPGPNRLALLVAQSDLACRFGAGEHFAERTSPHE